jgi:hypothetical protein
MPGKFSRHDKLAWFEQAGARDLTKMYVLCLIWVHICKFDRIYMHTRPKEARKSSCIQLKKIAEVFPSGLSRILTVLSGCKEPLTSLWNCESWSSTAYIPSSSTIRTDFIAVVYYNLSSLTVMSFYIPPLPTVEPISITHSKMANWCFSYLNDQLITAIL